MAIYEEDRKFLHDMASPITIMRLSLTRLQGLIKDNPAISTSSKELEYIQRTLSALQGIEDLHADFKSKISERESLEEKSRK